MRRLAVLLVIFFLPVIAMGDDEPFTGPLNWGMTGLMTVPTARVMKDNSFRVGYSYIYPYVYYYGAMSPAKGLEVGGRITQIRWVPGFAAGGSYGDYKDKATDLKYQFIPEGKYLPAVALGDFDFQGDRIYRSQFLVMSKQIFPFDFTLGFGDGRLGKIPIIGVANSIGFEMFNHPRAWLKNSQLFGGVQYALSEKYVLMAEYSPIKYENQLSDPAQAKYFTKPVPSPINIGFRWKPVKWTEIDLTYQRGNEIGVNISLPFEIGRPMLPIFDNPYKEPKEYQQKSWQERIEFALLYSGFSDFCVQKTGGTLVIDVQNSKYFYNTKALMALLKTISLSIPEDVEDVIIIFKEAGIPIFSFHAKREDIIDYFNGRLSAPEFFGVSGFETQYLQVPQGEKLLESRGLFYGYVPNFGSYLNDPSGFFKGRLGVVAWTGYDLWKGSSLIAGIGFFPYNTISTDLQPLSIPVRSDNTLYAKEFILDKLFFQQLYRFSPDIFTRVAGGILETEYAGIDVEIAKPLFGGRVFVGLSGSVVEKRDPAKPLSLLNKNDSTNVYNIKDVYTTSFFNTRINFPNSGTYFEIKYGRFLAGDVGTKLTVSKDIKGVELSFWYSFTNTNVFASWDTANRGYHDTGIALRIPMRLFYGKETQTTYYQSVSPWSRDVAQDIEHFTSLFDFIGANTKVLLDQEVRDLFY